MELQDSISPYRISFCQGKVVKDLSPQARLRTSGKIAFKEIRTREKEAKKKRTVFWFTWTWCCGSRGAQFFRAVWKYAIGLEKLQEQLDGEGLARLLEMKPTWRLLKVNQNLTKAKNASDATRDWGCWACSLQEGQAVPRLTYHRNSIFTNTATEGISSRTAWEGRTSLMWWHFEDILQPNAKT